MPHPFASLLGLGLGSAALGLTWALRRRDQSQTNRASAPSSLTLLNLWKAPLSVSLGLAMLGLFAPGLTAHTAIGFAWGALLATVAASLGMRLAVHKPPGDQEPAPPNGDHALTIMALSLALLGVTAGLWLVRPGAVQSVPWMEWLQPLLGLALGTGLTTLMAPSAPHADTARGPDPAWAAATRAQEGLGASVMTLITSMLLGGLALPSAPWTGALYAVGVGSLGLLGTLAGHAVSRHSSNPVLPSRRAVQLCGGLALLAAYPLAAWLIPPRALGHSDTVLRVWGAAVLGQILAMLLARAMHPAARGPETRLPSFVLAQTCLASVRPLLLICAAMVAASTLAGAYGMAVAASAMLALAGRPDTAAFLATPPSRLTGPRHLTIGASALGALAWISAYVQALHPERPVLTPDLAQQRLMLGLFLGSLMAWLCVSLALNARATAPPRRALGNLHPLTLRPALLALITPIVVSLGWGADVLGGLLMGVTLTGVFLAIALAMVRSPDLIPDTDGAVRAITTFIQSTPWVALLLLPTLTGLATPPITLPTPPSPAAQTQAFKLPALPPPAPQAAPVSVALSFAAGQADLPADALAQLDALIDALNQSPGSRLVLRAWTTDSDSDSAAIANRLLRARQAALTDLLESAGVPESRLERAAPTPSTGEASLTHADVITVDLVP